MTKPIYKYSDFVTKINSGTSENKRYWLELTIDETKTEGIIIILKNPSRAGKNISDKTVHTVSNYIYQNRQKYAGLNNIGKIIILNLMPNYMTESSGLQQLKKTIIDQENIRTLNEYCLKIEKVIIAWGNHPPGLYYEYEELKKSTMEILAINKNEIYFVDKMTNAGNPKHGQVWAYANKLIKFI